MSEALTAVCPYCRSGFEAADAVTRCASCGTPHHTDCYEENGGCTIFGCAAAPTDETKISVAPTDFQSLPSIPGSSPYSFAAPAQIPRQPASPPPPPLPPGSPAPPPLPTGMQPYGYGVTGLSAGQQFPAYGYGSYVRPKNRVTFILLAVFLGCFGAHNFYAGYTKKAVIQLCVTVCTCFWASIVSWIWAIVEACTVTQDDDGVLLS